jgi:hypothetical protein
MVIAVPPNWAVKSCTVLSHEPVPAPTPFAREFTDHPAEGLQRLVHLAQQPCGGHSAGISAYEPQPEGASIFHWAR